MITFLEDSSPNYASRTYINAKEADVTLILAMDLRSRGEICTMNACNAYNKKYFVFEINEDCVLGPEQENNVENCIQYLKDARIRNINIAGNGAHTFYKHNIGQDKVDELVYSFLKKLIDSGCPIEMVRSGGQTGVDEAGLKAGESLGCKTVCLCPKGWKFRTGDGKDISDKTEFIMRFQKRVFTGESETLF